MSKTLLVTMLALTASAQPYFPVLPPRSLYGSLVSPYTPTVEAVPTLFQEHLPGMGAVPAVVPGTLPAPFSTAAAYTTPELANYAFGDYSNLYGMQNFRSLASTYPVPQYGYAYGNYIYQR